MVIPENQLSDKLRKVIVLKLVRDGKISSGKGVEMLGIDKYEFIEMMSKNDISYFTESPEDC